LKQELRKCSFRQVGSTFSLAVIAGSANYVVIIVETCYIHYLNYVVIIRVVIVQAFEDVVKIDFDDILNKQMQPATYT
jgi:hypothetical protein